MAKIDVAGLLAALEGGKKDAIREELERIGEAFEADPSPFPVRRPATYGREERAIVRALARGGGEGYLRLGGLPQFASDAARLAGLAPEAALDAQVTVGGETAPAWCLLNDAQAGLVEIDPVVAAIVSRGPEEAAAMLGEIARGYYGLGFAPPVLAAHVKGGATWEERQARVLSALALHVGGPRAEPALWGAIDDLVALSEEAHGSARPALLALVELSRAALEPLPPRLAAAIKADLAETPPRALESAWPIVQRLLDALYPAEKPS